MSTTGGVKRLSAIRRWLPAVAWMALIFAFSSQSVLPGPADPLLDRLFKKGAHVVAYAVLAVLLERALARPRGGRWWALAGTLAYAVSDEFHQSFTPGRSPLASDVVIDMAGGLCGLYVRCLPLKLIGGRARSWDDRPGPGDDAPSV